MRMGHQDGWMRTAMIMAGDGDGEGLIYSLTTNQSSSPVQSSPVQSREMGQKEKWKWLQTTVALGRTAPHIKHAIGEDLIQDLGADSCRNNNVIFFLGILFGFFPID